MLISNPPGIDVRDTTICLRCRKELSAKARVQLVFIYIEKKDNQAVLLGRGLANGMMLLLNEFIHYDCKDPALRDVSLIIQPDRRSNMITQYPEIEPRGPDFRCVKCQKEYQRGDRLVIAYMVLGVGKNPDGPDKIAMVSGNYETVHLSCHDPSFGSGGDVLFVSEGLHGS
jgi:hypothetical protein